jgi:hypothetical protein
MKVTTVLGIILIVLGAVGLAVGGIRYTSDRHTMKLGPLEATVEEKSEIPIPPLAGGISVLAGIVLLAAGRKKG